MSRTYVHAPPWVKERDPAWRTHYKEDHNHAWMYAGHERAIGKDGSSVWKSIWKKVERCDLDEYLKSDVSTITYTACRIRLISRGRNVDCGCRMCTGQLSRRCDRRSERQRAKRVIRAGRWDEASFVNRSHLSW